jgi:AcrR family transcriptional regulator
MATARTKQARPRKSAARASASRTAQDATQKDHRKTLVERALVEKACIIFAEKGYDGTSLTDIAEAVGLTRGAVYYYFKNKEALLESIIREVAFAPLEEIAVWRKTAPDTASERLYAFVKRRVQNVLARQTQMRMIQVTEAALPPDLLQRHNDAKRKILDEYRSIIREGVRAGEFRPVDDSVAAFGIIGMVNWTAQWFVEGRGAGVDDVAAQLADMAVESVRGEKDRKDRFSNARTAIDTLREDLDQLEQIVTAPPPGAAETS